MGVYFIKRTVFLLTLTLFSLIESSEVPILVWNHKGVPLDIKPVSAFNKNVDGLMKQLTEALNKDASILVFMMDHISLEDFTEQSTARKGILQPLMSEFEYEPVSLLPSVKDPIKHIENLPCEAKNIYPNADAKLSKDVISALDRSCVVIVHLPSENLINSYTSDLTDVLSSVKKTDKNIVGLLTGKQSSWMSEGRHKSRSVLAAAAKDEHFVNYTGCILFYAENVTVHIGGASNESHVMHFPPTVNGECQNVSWLSLDFPGSGDVESLTLLLTFESDARTWRMTNATATVTGKTSLTEIEMNPEFIFEAALGFSYSCGDLVLQAKNKSHSIVVRVPGFQIQPYRVNGVFSPSFNCVPWFTLPILMGILVALLFIMILNFGIYALFNIKTMDRFDDPKGKTISVPTGND